MLISKHGKEHESDCRGKVSIEYYNTGKVMGPHPQSFGVEEINAEL